MATTMMSILTQPPSLPLSNHHHHHPHHHRRRITQLLLSGEEEAYLGREMMIQVDKSAVTRVARADLVKCLQYLQRRIGAYKGLLVSLSLYLRIRSLLDILTYTTPMAPFVMSHGSLDNAHTTLSLSTHHPSIIDTQYYHHHLL